MKGSERMLYIGNMNTLCSQDQESFWQPKRIIVTDYSIYYFQYTNFKGTKIGEDWVTFKESTLTLPQIQERTLLNKKIDIDSVSAPPQLVVPVSDRQAFLLSIEQFLQLAVRAGLTRVQHTGKVVCLLNKATKEVQYMIPADDNQGYLFYRALTVANAFSKYYTYCSNQGHSPVPLILKWLQESIQIIVPILVIEFEQLIPTYKFLSETTSAVNGFNFKLNLKLHFKTFQMLHSCLKDDSLMHLTLSGVELTTPMISDLVSMLQNNAYLEELDLSNNQIDDKGLDVLSRLFEHCPELKHLSLAYNRIQGSDLTFEIFLLKLGQILLNVQLDLKGNELNDLAIPALESRLLQDEQSNVIQINLSYNKFTRQGIWKLFLGLVEAKRDHELQFKIFPLPFSVQMIQMIAESERKPFFDLNKSSRKTLTSTAGRKSFFDVAPEETEHLNLTIQRKKTSKQQVTTNLALDLIDQKKRQIEELFSGTEPTVESVYQICAEIQDFEYQLPSRLIMWIQEWVWRKLNEAILVRDHYATSYLTFAAFSLEMDVSIFKEKYSQISKRMQRLERKINALLNFQVEESKINSELDNLISECYRLDIRGQPLDFLIALKLQREELVRQFIETDYDWQLDAQNDVLGDNLAYLNRDLLRIDEPITPQLEALDLDENLFKHPTRINYIELSRIPVADYELQYERLLKLLEHLRTFEEKSLLHLSSLEDFRVDQFQKTKLQGTNAMRRIVFLKHDHMISFDYQSWLLNQEDLLLNSVRLLVQYRSAKYRLQQIRPYLERLSHQYQNMTIREILQDMDQKNIDFEQRFLVSDIQIMFAPSTGTEESDDNIIRYRNQYSSIQDYPFVGLSKISILNIEDPLFIHVAQQIQQYLKGVLQEIQCLAQPHLSQTLFLRYIKHLIDICAHSPCPSLFGDELYLNIVLIKESPLVHKIIQVLLLFVPPSLNLFPSFRNWLDERNQFESLELLEQYEAYQQLPYWLPCEMELQLRFNSRKQFLIHDRVKLSIELDLKDSVKQVVEKVYDRNFADDQHYYWIYLRCGYAKVGEHTLFVDMPLNVELGFLEQVSRLWARFPSPQNRVLIKRRIFQAFASISGDDFSNYKDSYINLPYIYQVYNFQSIMMIAAIFLTIEIKQELQEQSIKILKYTKLQNADDFKQKLLEDVKIDHQRLQQYLPNALKNTSENLQPILLNMRQLVGLSEKELVSLFTSIMRVNPATSGSCFNVVIESKKYLMIVNNFCIIFYSGVEFDFGIMYQHILGISISGHQMRIHTFKAKLEKLVLTFQFEQALECYQDILSYQQIRLSESLEHLYAYNEFTKMKYHYNIQLCDEADQNGVVAKMVQLAEERQLENYHEHVKKSFSSQIYLANFVKKQSRLLEAYQQTPQNIVPHPSLPYHLSCPLVHFVDPPKRQMEDISRYFGKNGKQELSKLLQPHLSHFPKVQVKAESLNTTVHQRESLQVHLKTPVQGRRSLRPPQFESRKQSLLSSLSQTLQRTEQQTQRSIEEAAEAQFQYDYGIAHSEPGDAKQESSNHGDQEHPVQQFQFHKDYIYQINEIDEEHNRSDLQSNSVVSSQLNSSANQQPSQQSPLNRSENKRSENLKQDQSIVIEEPSQISKIQSQNFESQPSQKSLIQESQTSVVPSQRSVAPPQKPQTLSTHEKLKTQESKKSIEHLRKHDSYASRASNISFASKQAPVKVVDNSFGASENETSKVFDSSIEESRFNSMKSKNTTQQNLKSAEVQPVQQQPHQPEAPKPDGTVNSEQDQPKRSEQKQLSSALLSALARFPGAKKQNQ